MRDTRVILVEGMPGTGKSTTSQFIDLQLRSNGVPCRWHHEERAGHPVRLFYDPERHRSGFGYAEDAELRWLDYVKELRAQNQVDVLDAALLQNHVRSMLLFDCDRDSIVDLARRIGDLLASLNPVFVYMRPMHIESLFESVCEVRGQQLLDLWVKSHEQFPYARRNRLRGYAGFMAFWREFSGISDRVFRSSGMAKIQLDVSGSNWDVHNQRVLGFLELPASESRSASVPLAHFAGTYVALGEDAGSSCVVRVSERCLVASCDQPTMDVERGPIGCFREVRFIPNESKDFYVAGWPHHVQFVEDGLGTVTSMRVTVSRSGWIPRSQVYVKQR